MTIAVQESYVFLVRILVAQVKNHPNIKRQVFQQPLVRSAGYEMRVNGCYKKKNTSNEKLHHDTE